MHEPPEYAEFYAAVAALAPLLLLAQLIGARTAMQERGKIR